MKTYTGQVFLLTRDKSSTPDDAYGDYRLWGLRAKPTICAGVWYAGRRLGDWWPYKICPRTWHRTAPLLARLKPGGGPIRVRVRVEVEL